MVQTGPVIEPGAGELDGREAAGVDVAALRDPAEGASADGHQYLIGPNSRGQLGSIVHCGSQQERVLRTGVAKCDYPNMRTVVKRFQEPPGFSGSPAVSLARGRSPLEN